MSKTPDAPPAEAADAAPKKKKGGGLLNLLLLVPMILVPASAGAYLAYDHYTSIARTAAAFGLTGGLQDEAVAAEGDEAHAEAEEEEAASEEFGQFKVITDLLINPAGTNGKRFLMVNIGLESKSEDALAELDAKDAVIRDIFLQLLGRRTVEELSSVTAREQLKEELRVAVNGILKEGTIDRLYFTQFVLQ